MTYINLLDKQLETIHKWFLYYRGQFNFRIHYLDNDTFLNINQLKNDLTTTQIFNKIELDSIFNRNYRFKIDIEDYYKQDYNNIDFNNKANTCFIQIENEIVKMNLVPSTYSELSISKRYFDSNINLIKTTDLKDLTFILSGINKVIYNAFPDHFKDKINLLEVMKNNRLNLKDLFNNNFTNSNEWFEEVYKLQLDKFKENNQNNEFTELEFKNYLIDYLSYSVNYDILEDSKKECITNFRFFLLKKNTIWELKDYYNRYLVNKKFHCFVFNTTFRTNGYNGLMSKLEKGIRTQTTYKDFVNDLENCKIRFYYIYDKLNDLDKIELKTNFLQHLKKLKKTQIEDLIINEIVKLINTIKNKITNLEPQPNLNKENNNFINQPEAPETDLEFNRNYFNEKTYNLFLYLIKNYEKKFKVKYTNIWYFLKYNIEKIKYNYKFNITQDKYKSFIKENYNIKILKFKKAEYLYNQHELPTLNNLEIDFREQNKPK